MANTDFVCNKCGMDSYAVNQSGLPVGDTVTINGKSDLSEAIHFNDDGRVFAIMSVNNNDDDSSDYQYRIEVDARGPKGAGSGSGHLYFTDASGDTYSLSIYNSSRKWHNVKFSSGRPQITQIAWSNYSNEAEEEKES